MRLYPGFDLLRILAASAVVLSHAFLIAELTEANEPAKAATGVIFGIYGVMVFFILSGFLVTDSAIRSPSLAAFTLKRVRRLLPGFVAVNLIVVLLIAPLFATNGPRAFLSDGETWTRLFGILLFRDQVLNFPETVRFFPTDEGSEWLGSMANGVLWTIRIEVTCYAAVAMLLLAGLLGRGAVLVLACLTLFCALSPAFYVSDYVSGLIYLAPCFAAGMVMRLFLDDHRADGRVALASAVALVILMLKFDGWSEHAGIFFPVFAAYPLLWFGQQDRPPLRAIGRFGDPSYGMYLWGWPIQMVLRALVGPGWSGWAFAALSLPLVMLAGYLSWGLIERRFLRHGPAEPARRTAPYRVGTGVPPR